MGGNPQPFKVDLPLHIETFYRYQFNDRISLTPGLIWLTALNQDNDNPDSVIVTLRWFHMFTDDVISMPDKWEYPWFAAWDLAFHMIPLSVVDQDFAKDQLMLMLREDYLHPNGQIPAYEWNFGDVNPPVHAWATWEIYTLDRERNEGKGDIEFLKYAFSKLLINFTWWVNRKDEGGNNVFEGGASSV